MTVIIKIDDPLVMDANYDFTKADRRKIDDQIRALQAFAANGGGGTSNIIDVFSARPAPGLAGRIFQATDNTRRRYMDDGSAWRPIIGDVLGIAPPAASSLTKQGSAADISVADYAGGLRFTSTGTGLVESDLYSLATSVAGHHFVFEAAIRASWTNVPDGQQATDSLPIGLAVLSSGTALKRYCYYSVPAGTSHIQWQNFASIGGPNTAGANDRALHTYEFDHNQVVWLRITEDATYRTYYFSTDGVTWITFSQEAVNNYITTAKVGFWIDSNGGSKVTADILHATLTLTS